MIRAMLLAALTALGWASTASAQGISARQSFRVGSGAATLCTAQSQIQDPAFGTMFDQAYQIVCRDAAMPVGQLYVLRGRGGEPAARLAGLRAGRVTCGGPEPVEIEGLGAAVCGISVDDSASHAAFARKYNLPFALLADRSGQVASRYGSLLNLGVFRIAKRDTFLVDPQGKVAKVYVGVNAGRNAKDVAEDLRAITKE